MITAPCKDCSERHSACWDRCEKYQAFKTVNEQTREEMRKTYAPSVTAKRRSKGVRLGGRGLWQ